MVSTATTMDEELAGAVGRQRQLASLFGVLSAAALFLSSIGIGSLVAFTVERRGRELGVRRALGAPARALLMLVLKATARDLGIGLVAGVVLAWLVARLLGGLLFGVGILDPAPFALAAGVLAAVTIAAAWIPARRVARLDPMTVLREE
jgi:ABC-type antimicrobial peptide transport system permease subunit